MRLERGEILLVVLFRYDCVLALSVFAAGVVIPICENCE